MSNWVQGSSLCQRLWIFIPCKNVGSKQRQKLLHNTKKSSAGFIKTSSTEMIQKTAEAAGDHLIGNRISKKIVRAASKRTCKDPRKSKVTQINETSVQPKEITPKKSYILPGTKQEINHKFRLF